MGAKRLHGLDGLRGLAALLVALFHMDYIYSTPGFFQRCYILVDLFFMLSGFVLARTFEARMAEGLTPRSFVVMRFRRLWAPVSIGSLIGIGLWFLKGVPLSTCLTYLVIATLLLPDLIIEFGTFPYNQPAWSITFELVANLVHVAILSRLRVPVLLAIAFASALTLLSSPFAGSMDVGSSSRFLYGFPRVLMSYSLGIVLWRTLGDKSRCSPWPAFVGAPVIFIGYSTLIEPDLFWFDLPVAIGASALLIISGLGVRENGRLAHACAAGGALSFPLYAVHYPVFLFVQATGGAKWIALAIAVALAAVIALTLEKASWPAGTAAATT